MPNSKFINLRLLKKKFILPIFIIAILSFSFIFSTVLDLWLSTPLLALPINNNENPGSLILDKNTNQTIAAYPGKSKYESVSIYNLPQNFIKAVLTLEDKNFFENPTAIPWTSMAKVSFDCATKHDNCRGGSGIVQQLVKNVSGNDSPTLKRKIDELFLSLKLGQSVSKQTILETYLNSVYYGQNSYGVETASKTYFNHSALAKDNSGKYLLSDTKACFLASLLQSPDAYSKSIFKDQDQNSVFLSRITFCLENMNSTSLAYSKGTRPVKI
jgi:membrane peptidoglycan carboxypeptidase